MNVSNIELDTLIIILICIAFIKTLIGLQRSKVELSSNSRSKADELNQIIRYYLDTLGII